MISFSVGVKAYYIFFMFRRELEFDFVWIIWKNRSFSSRFVGFWNCDLRTDFFNGFL